MKTASIAAPALPSDRKFGWTFAALFTLVAFVHPVALALAVLFAAITMLRAELLAPLKRAWMKLGELMNHVVSPIVLGVIFFGVFAPVGVAMRLFGRDAMAREWDEALPSYWKRRDPPGPADDSFNDQF